MHKQMTHTHPTHRTLRVENSIHYQSIQCLSGPPVDTQVPHPDVLLGKDGLPAWNLPLSPPGAPAAESRLRTQSQWLSGSRSLAL